LFEPVTNKVPLVNIDPVTVNDPVIKVLMLTTNPSTGDIEAVALPLAI
jgi:hypothetical protein